MSKQKSEQPSEEELTRLLRGTMDEASLVQVERAKKERVERENMALKLFPTAQLLLELREAFLSVSGIEEPAIDEENVGE